MPERHIAQLDLLALYHSLLLASNTIPLERDLNLCPCLAAQHAHTLVTHYVHIRYTAIGTHYFCPCFAAQHAKPLRGAPYKSNKPLHGKPSQGTPYNTAHRKPLRGAPYKSKKTLPASIYSDLL